jgi:hypothetical protein
MGTEYAFVSTDRSDFKHDLLSYQGMAPDARERMREAEAKKKAAAAAKLAAEAAKPQDPGGVA